jgi:hypothetical protein
VDELVLLANDSSGWEAVPFQIDEVTDSSKCAMTEDRLLEAIVGAWRSVALRVPEA